MAKLIKHIYAALTQVLSANLNDGQDEAINDPKRVPAAVGYQSAGSVGSAFDGAGTYMINNPDQTLTVPIDIKPGVRLIAVRVRMTDQAGFGGGDAMLDVRKATDGVGASLGTSAASDQSGTAQTLVVSGLTEDVTEIGVSVGQVYLAEITFSGASPQSIHAVEWETDIIP